MHCIPDIQQRRCSAPDIILPIDRESLYEMHIGDVSVTHTKKNNKKKLIMTAIASVIAAICVLVGVILPITLSPKGTTVACITGVHVKYGTNTLTDGTSIDVTWTSAMGDFDSYLLQCNHIQAPDGYEAMNISLSIPADQLSATCSDVLLGGFYDVTLYTMKDNQTIGPCHKYCNCSQQVMTAGSVFIASTAGAAEYHGGGLGLFDVTGDLYDSRPVYQQRGGIQYLYYRSMYGAWYAGPEVGGNGVLKSISSSTTPPESGWEYWLSSDSDWHSDPTCILTSPAEPVWQQCITVTVHSTGPAAIAQSSRMGNYTWRGDWLKGRMLYEREEGGQYLQIVTGYVNWRIGPKKNSSSSGIRSGRGTSCPCDPAAGPSDRLNYSHWRYYDSSADVWREDPGLTVTCP